jgi:N-acetylglucosamine kinase-like BadF-type ATPase
MDEDLVIGVDAGASNVRVLVADRTGRRLGSGTAAGASPIARGLPAAMEQLDIALGRALDGLDPARVRVVAIGMAGAGTFGPALPDALAGVAARRGIPGQWLHLSDLEVAFAAGSAEPGGLVVLSGTGAAVAEIRDGSMTRYLDGAGWLLGDLGSGFWLGWQAARAAVADREGRGPATVLTGRLSERLGVRYGTGYLPGADPDTKVLERAIYQRTPVSLAELAPLVSTAAAEGDSVAAGLIDEAATTLLDEVALVLRDRPDVTSVVFAGSVLLADGPLREAVAKGLARYTIGEARDGAGGAAWRALHELDQPLDPVVHERLTRS